MADQPLSMEPGCNPPRRYEEVPGGVLVWSQPNKTGWMSTFIPGVEIRREEGVSRLVRSRADIMRSFAPEKPVEGPALIPEYEG